MPRPLKERPRLKTPAIELLAINVLKLRREKGWSQEDLAFEAGLPRALIGKIETKSRNPTLDTVEALAAALNVSFAGLFVDEKSTAP